MHSGEMDVAIFSVRDAMIRFKKRARLRRIPVGFQLKFTYPLVVIISVLEKKPKPHSISVIVSKVFIVYRQNIHECSLHVTIFCRYTSLR